MAMVTGESKTWLHWHRPAEQYIQQIHCHPLWAIDQKVVTHRKVNEFIHTLVKWGRVFSNAKGTPCTGVGLSLHCVYYICTQPNVV